MLFFFHLFSGIVAGLVLYYFLRDRRAIFFAALGGILPDLIDKPVGHIFLAEEIGSGRLVFHGFWLVLFLVVVGICIFIRYKNPVILALSVGVAVHQAADSMWSSPVEWFWPFLGPYPGGYELKSYFFDMLFKEISSFEEVSSFFMIIILGWIIFNVNKGGRNDPGTNRGICTYFGIFMIVFGIVYLISQLLLAVTSWETIIFTLYTGWFDILLFGLTTIVGGIVIICLSGDVNLRSFMNESLDFS